MGCLNRCRCDMRAFLLTLVTLLVSAGPARANQSPLADAAERKDRAGISALISEKADLNAAQPDGMTALHWAVYQDDLETAKLLVNAGANVKATNAYGVSSLPLACMNGNGEMVELLLDAGADPNATLNGGETVLMTAARTGQPGAVEALLKHGADVNAKERHGQTAIMWAASDGNAEVVRMLLKAGAEFRTPLENSGFTPLFFAVREGRAEVTRILLKAGADVNEAMHPGKPSGKGPRPGTSALILAVENGHFELAVELLEAGADPNDMRSGFSPLHTMTWVRKPNRGDGDDGDPPPIGSGKLSSLQFVRKLVEHGADVNARLKTGKGGRGQLARLGATPFLLAAFTDDAPFMRLLVELGADPLLPNSDGSTPLMAAAGLGCLAAGEEAGTEDEAVEAVKLALKLGGDVNAVDKHGETAMHGAAYKNFPKVVQLLAENGAKIDVWNRTNKWGWTPLLIAQGYRPGNFKPSFETIDAIEKVMLAAGVPPPPDPSRNVAVESGYTTDDVRKAAAGK